MFRKIKYSGFKRTKEGFVSIGKMASFHNFVFKISRKGKYFEGYILRDGISVFTSKINTLPKVKSNLSYNFHALLPSQREEMKKHVKEPV
ncbi:MAG: hypothetical protein ACTSYF_05080 [Promethearchaeota archaeon]